MEQNTLTLDEWCTQQGIDTCNLSKKALNFLSVKVVVEISSTKMEWDKYISILRNHVPFKTRSTYWFIILENNWAMGINENPSIGITYPMVKCINTKDKWIQDLLPGQ